MIETAQEHSPSRRHTKALLQCLQRPSYPPSYSSTTRLTVQRLDWCYLRSRSTPLARHTELTVCIIRHLHPRPLAGSLARSPPPSDSTTAAEAGLGSCFLIFKYGSLASGPFRFHSCARSIVSIVHGWLKQWLLPEASFHKRPQWVTCSRSLPMLRFDSQCPRQCACLSSSKQLLPLLPSHTERKPVSARYLKPWHAALLVPVVWVEAINFFKFWFASVLQRPRLCVSIITVRRTRVRRGTDSLGAQSVRAGRTVGWAGPGEITSQREPGPLDHQTTQPFYDKPTTELAPANQLQQRNDHFDPTALGLSDSSRGA